MPKQHALMLTLLLSIAFCAACTGAPDAVEGPPAPTAALTPLAQATPTSAALFAIDSAATLESSKATSTAVARAGIVATEQAHQAETQSAQSTADWKATLDVHALDVQSQMDAISVSVAISHAEALARLDAYSNTLAQIKIESAHAQATAQAEQDEIDNRNRNNLWQVVAKVVGGFLVGAGVIFLYYYRQREQMNTHTHWRKQRALIEEVESTALVVIARNLLAAKVTINGEDYVPHWRDVDPKKPADERLLIKLLPSPVVEHPPTRPQTSAAPSPGLSKARASEIRAVLKRLVYHGVYLGGFGERRLVRDFRVVLNRDDHEPSNAGYRLLAGWLIEMGVLVAPLGKETTWAAGWGVERFERDFDTLPLPAIASEVALPEVITPVRTFAPSHLRTFAPPPRPGESADAPGDAPERAPAPPGAPVPRSPTGRAIN